MDLAKEKASKYIIMILKMTKKYDKSAEFKNNNDGNDADNDEL